MKGGPSPCISNHLVIDAMSLLAAVTADQVRMPAENSLLGHLRWLRELLDRNQLRAFTWCDTRDMLSDGLTKARWTGRPFT